MIDITILAANPAALRTALVARGIIKLNADGTYSGALPGVDLTWDTVPNPIVTTLATGTFGQPGYTLAVMDNRSVYLLRLSHDSDAADDDGTVTLPTDPTPRYTKSKIVQWVIANSTAVTLTSADGKTYRTRKINAANIWLVVPADMAAFGAWQ